MPCPRRCPALGDALGVALPSALPWAMPCPWSALPSPLALGLPPCRPALGDALALPPCRPAALPPCRPALGLPSPCPRPARVTIYIGQRMVTYGHSRYVVPTHVNPRTYAMVTGPGGELPTSM
jgi:hypothetical protein